MTYDILRLISDAALVSMVLATAIIIIGALYSIVRKK